MSLRAHYLPDLIIALVCCGAAAILAAWAAPLEKRRRRAIWLLLAFLALLNVVTAALLTGRVARHFDHNVVAWTRCAGLVSGGLLLWAVAVIFPLRRFRMFDPGRRQILRLTATAAAAAPVVIGSYAIIRRDDLRFREIDVRIPSLPRDLQGLRIAQVTDIHLSPFVEEATLRRAIGMANESKPHLTMVTGDLITTRGDPLDVCLKRLSELRADSGVWGCMGNHERYSGAETYTEREARRSGIRFLRREAVSLGFGDSTINLVGVDYQRKGDPYLTGLESLIVPDGFNLLLSHNPDVFPVAAQQGFDFTIAGHTHGGQVTFEMIHPALNVARFVTPFVHGLYERGGKQMYVSRGVGTIGIPARLGAPPEVVVLRLCAT